MDSKELRQKYLSFFQEKGHKVIASASVIPEHDPSVLFTTAGMHPLVPYLMGEPHPQGNRLTNAQKCVRTDDIEAVGDAFHHTFFEMLGNWSLGDYFKQEAIAWSYEFLTSPRWLGLEPSMLAVTVFAGDSDAARDDESAQIWRSLGIPENRIAYLPKKNNWWGPAGKTGPCGPCTEMFYWVGGQTVPPESNPGNDEQSWVEIWNDVFMQFLKDDQGKYTLLTRCNVDTGMGLERTLAILTGKSSDFETDLFAPLIQLIRGVSAGSDTRAERIIVDHMRAAVFMLGDDNGVVPSNTDQGYILRRLIRRAITYSHKLGIKDSFTKSFAEQVISQYSPIYPELQRNSSRIFGELKKEEERFRETLEKGLKHFERLVPQNNIVAGEDAFILYSTFGFPLELTEELVAERGWKVDQAAYQQALAEHQRVSKLGAERRFSGGLADHSEITVKYHTTTHLLHRALKNVLGEHVQQRGSNITAERLRFDFSHPEKMTPEQITKVEAEVNSVISQDLPVQMEITTVENAKAKGAIGLFEHKYGESVKMYSIGGYSVEICGGPHVEHTGALGKLKIQKEESSGAGIRRIRAVLS